MTIQKVISGLHRPIQFIHRFAPDRTISVLVLGGKLRGRSLYLNLRYQMGYWLGLAEPDLQHALVTQVTLGDVVYDVGAEIGYFSLLSAQLARPGRVYAFEPDPSNITTLCRNVRRNSDLGVQIVPLAVGDRCRRAEFLTYSHRNNIANASLLGRLSETTLDTTEGKSLTVDMIDLDSFSEESQTKPNIVKIDVEGAEGLVLRGMERLLRTVRPRILIEVHHGTALEDVIAILFAHHYQVSELGRTFNTLFPVRLLCLPQPCVPAST